MGHLWLEGWLVEDVGALEGMGLCLVLYVPCLCQVCPLLHC